ncbi:sigma-70 family RNA polymerase sigma factor [Mucilaginibacter sabulilitoris]|uniref:Sigma-70 family RNA polymerase sigma factor n=1 Tax=Mucilaginibacter sabulilitoris TaxID=1173583 RepID=A0ABZ0TGP3_9SPHI|nr:sigma-70 family RNA polymerase sigma factor [Mucilaginibacter sabulilitoris]WPU91582.1 sigma-70 family RNA polymerase sigma factor [Mucilaginibacter sabulilitoris]
MGLINAAHRYDTSRGFKFISYAVWWIRQAIIAAIAEQSRLVHIPCNFYTLIGKIKKSEAKLEQELKRKPTPEEIADHLHMKIEKLHDLLSFFNHEISLDKLSEDSAELSLLDILPSKSDDIDSDLSLESKRLVIDSALNILNAREKEILQLYFGLNAAIPVPIEQIAKKFELSVEHIRRLRDNALYRIRCSSYGAILQSYVN